MQNENKPLSGRGGARPGAGRPTGTTKENKKKPCSFKLSESEEQTTRKVLSDMRNDDIFKFDSLPLINPMMIWSLLSKEDITYSWLLERKLKEDKENSSLA